MSMNEGYLVAGMLLAFPISIIYRLLLLSASPTIKHLYLSVTGLGLYLLCFGVSSLHVISMITLSYLTMSLSGPGPVTCTALLLLTMSHLLYGYVTVAGVTYSVTWTLVYCQALLKVVGYFIDQMDEMTSSPRGKEMTSRDRTFLSYLGYVVCPFTCLVGPQFQYSTYTEFIQQTEIREPVTRSLKTGLTGVCYIGLYYGLKQFTSTDYLLSPAFLSWSLPAKMLFITFWTKWFITKYCAIWCIAECAAGLGGLGGDGVRNVDVVKFETSLTIQDELTSFNIQTHRWVKRNVYKRCRGLGSPLLSRVLSLLFLYLWHGIYFGFLNIFLVEGLGMSTEAALSRYISREGMRRYLPGPVVTVVQYVMKNMCVGYGLVGFALRSRDRCHLWYGSVWYCGHVVMVVWLLVEGVVIRRRVKRKDQ